MGYFARNGSSGIATHGVVMINWLLPLKRGLPMYRLFVLAAFVLALAAPAQAGMLTLSGLPTEFKPGVDFGFDVKLAGETGLSSYQVTVRMESDGSMISGYSFFVDVPTQRP